MHICHVNSGCSADRFSSQPEPSPFLLFFARSVVPARIVQATKDFQQRGCYVMWSSFKVSGLWDTQSNILEQSCSIHRTSIRSYVVSDMASIGSASLTLWKAPTKQCWHRDRMQCSSWYVVTRFNVACSKSLCLKYRLDELEKQAYSLTHLSSRFMLGDDFSRLPPAVDKARLQ